MNKKIIRWYGEFLFQIAILPFTFLSIAIIGSFMFILQDFKEQFERYPRPAQKPEPVIENNEIPFQSVKEDFVDEDEYDDNF